MSERTIRRSIALVADLSPRVIAGLRGTYLENHAADLAKLADLPSAEQLDAVDRLQCGSIRRLADLRPKDRLPADEAQFAALADAWKRASTKARRRFLRHIGAAPSHKAELTLVSSHDEGAA